MHCLYCTHKIGHSQVSTTVCVLLLWRNCAVEKRTGSFVNLNVRQIFECPIYLDRYYAQPFGNNNLFLQQFNA